MRIKLDMNGGMKIAKFYLAPVNMMVSSKGLTIILFSVEKSSNI